MNIRSKAVSRRSSNSLPSRPGAMPGAEHRRVSVEGLGHPRGFIRAIGDSVILPSSWRHLNSRWSDRNRTAAVVGL